MDKGTGDKKYLRKAVKYPLPLLYSKHSTTFPN